MANDIVLKKGLPLGKKAIRYVDGFMLRNLMTDLDIVLWREKEGVLPSAFVPDDEIWIDWRYKDETDFLLDVTRIESLPEFADKPYSHIRAYLKETLCDKDPAPDFTARTEKRGKLTIRYVSGNVVRRHFDPAFIFGGHDLVYDYIPKNEVWIDIYQDLREVRFTIAHELKERALMAKGMNYDDAHAQAIAIEVTPRAKIFTVDMEGPLELEPFRQEEAYCGPASLKIVLGYLGKEFSESRLARMCGTTKREGTDHRSMIKGAKKAGATVFEKKDATYDDIRYFVHTERLPVIIGWVSTQDLKTVKPEDDEHYSVVYRITDKHIYIMDPEVDWGRKRMTLKEFDKVWWDSDGPSARIDRWFMVLNFEGMTYHFPGGENH